MATAGGGDPAGGHGEAGPRTVAGAAAPGGGVLLGHDIDTGDDVWLPDAARLRGVTVVGKTGTGKSRLLERLLLADLHHGTPAVVIDPHGQLAARVLALAPPQAADRLLLEPWPDRPWRLNLLACPDPGSDTAVDRTVDHTVEVFKKLFDRAADYQPRLKRDLDAAVRTVIPNHGTLLDVLRLFVDDGLRERYRGAVADPAVAEYWDYFARLGRDAERARQVEATVNRLYRLLAPRLIRRIVDTTTTTTVPFEAVLAGDQMLLLSIPAGGLTAQRCDFLGALFLAALTDRIFARQAATEEPGRLHLYIDEYARFATPMTAELFAEGRKYGVGLTVAHQTLAQIADAANRAAERQAGALVLFQLTGPDAEELAGELDTTPTRTKVTMRQRTTPQYQEWDEQVWDSPEAEHAHAQAQAQLATLTDTVGAALARRKASYHLLEYAYGWTGTFDKLLAGTLDPVKTHQPFNPKYLSGRVKQ